jgi:hypothetical protein
MPLCAKILINSVNVFRTGVIGSRYILKHLRTEPRTVAVFSGTHSGG